MCGSVFISTRRKTDKKTVLPKDFPKSQIHYFSSIAMVGKINDPSIVRVNLRDRALSPILRAYTTGSRSEVIHRGAETPETSVLSTQTAQIAPNLIVDEIRCFDDHLRFDHDVRKYLYYSPPKGDTMGN